MAVYNTLQPSQTEEEYKKELRTLKRDLNYREYLGHKKLQRDDSKALYEIELGEFMSKESRIEKMLIALTERVDNGFKEVNARIDVLTSDVKEIKEAVIELQDQAKEHGWEIKKDIKVDVK